MGEWLICPDCKGKEGNDCVMCNGNGGWYQDRQPGHGLKENKKE